jgi:hypothetical protein
MHRPLPSFLFNRTHLGLVCALATLGCQEHKITAFNSTPEVSITSHTKHDALVEGMEAIFRGRVTDDDDAPDSLITNWVIGDRDACSEVEPTSNGATVCALTLGPEDFSDGEARVSLTAIDPGNSSATTHLTLSAVANNPPSASIIAPMPDGEGTPPRFYADQPIDLVGLVGDAEDFASDLSIAWESTEDGVLPVEIDVEADGSIHNTTYLSQGNQTLSLRVTDHGGLTSSDQVLIEVVGPNEAPNCSITIPTSASIFNEAEPITLGGTASDPNSPDLAGLGALWESDRDGVINSDPPSSTGLMGFTLPSLTPGDHLIQLVVTDDGALSCVDTINLSVRANPYIIATSPEDGTVVTEGDAVSLSATVADVEDDADELIVSWSSNLDGPIGTRTADEGGVASEDAESLTAGEHTITVTVTDTDGMSASESQDLWVNQRPTPPEVSLSPALPQTTDDLLATIDVESIDPEGAGISYSFVWRVDGALSLLSTTDLLSSSATRKGQVWSIEVTPTDGDTTGPAATASNLVLNTPPVLATVSLSPIDPLSTDTLSCMATGAADSDGDTVSLSTVWTVDGSPMDTGSDTLGPESFSPGSFISCAITPDDGEALGGTLSSSVIRVNVPPVLHSIAVNPETPTVEDTLSCMIGLMTDSDGDPVTHSIKWFINGIDVGVSAESLDAGLFAKGDEIHCEATPDDGHEPGASLSADAVTVENAVPVFTGLSLSPEAATTHTVITASVGATDPDLDSITFQYSWSVNDVVVSSTGSSLDGSLYFDKDDTVVLSVTASDGTDTTAPWATSGILVANTPPTSPSVSITPEAPAAAVDDLVCAVSAPSTDDDLDAVSYTINWSRDGEAFTATIDTESPGDTIPGHVTFAGEDWSCTVIPTDGTDVGDPGMATIRPEWRFSGWGDDPFPLTAADAHLVGTSNLANAGAEIAVAGDIDGDGMLDMLVGAPQNDEGGSNSGKAYLVLSSHFVGGDTALLSGAHRTFAGVEETGRLGFALAGGGNVGGDLRPDLFIGAYGQDYLEPDDGTIGVFWDGGPLSPDPLNLDDADVIIHGGTDRELAGYDLAIIPDMDGDTLDELLVGAPHNDSGGSRSGVAYLVRGSELSTGDTVDLADMPHLYGESGLDRAGDQVRHAGDLDSDGIPDLMISAPFNETGGNKAGRVYIVYGADALTYSTLLLADADIRIEGEEAFDEAGTGLSGGQDVDGDGAPEIIIGAPYNDAGEDNAGRAYLFWGASLGVTEAIDAADADVIFNAVEEDGELGTSVSASTDVDGDGLAEVIIGVPGSNVGGSQAGAALLFHGEFLSAGGVFTPDDADYSFYGTGADDHAGQVVLGTGDIDADGFGDIAVGEPDDTSIYGSRSGTVHLLFAP